ncbi:MAG: hypothetical protein U0931_19050 [Vulcanimicrobiota bacterium]
MQLTSAVDPLKHNDPLSDPMSMLHPYTRAFLQGLRPWLYILLALRFILWLEPWPPLWAAHQLALALGAAAGWWSLQRSCPLNA